MSNGVLLLTIQVGVIAATFLPACAADTPKPTTGGYVGHLVCRTCHPAVWQNFYKNPHFKSIAAGNLANDQTGCESCHGPGKQHVDASGGKATIRSAFSIIPPKAALDVCLSCHGKDFSRHNIQRSVHTQANVVCNNCHSIHKPASPKSLLAAKQADLCSSCHASVKAQFAMPFKHRVEEGFVQCSDCHNPHGAVAATWRMGVRPRMAAHAQSNEEACLKCHSDKRGPFAFEHTAVRIDGCESCHAPHGSMNAKLLRRPTVATVCLECHNGTSGFGRASSGIRTQSASHNMADPRYQKCTVCHVRIHGSNADPRFLR